MTTVIVERDEAAEARSDHYRYTRTVEIAGRIVRATVKRDFYAEYSLAYVEMINDHKSWTQLADAPASDWWHDTRQPSADIAVTAVLGPVAERLLRRAAAILAPPTGRALSPHLLDAISALLAGSYGHDGEHRIDPEDITWATTHGNALRIIEHTDGSVTFTKAHRADCPFITSDAAVECDDHCDRRHPADQ